MVTEEAQDETAIMYARNPSFNRLCLAKLTAMKYGRLYYREILMALAVVFAVEFLRRRIRSHYRETQLVNRCVAKVLDLLAERVISLPDTL